MARYMLTSARFPDWTFDAVDDVEAKKRVEEVLRYRSVLTSDRNNSMILFKIERVCCWDE